MNNMYNGQYYQSKKTPVGQIVTYIVLGIIILILAVVLIFSIMRGSSKPAESSVQVTSSNDNPNSTEPPLIVITECPEQINSDEDKFTLRGYVVSDAGECELTVNGEKICSTNSAGIQKEWSKSFYISAGDTKKLEITAKDANGNTSEEKRTVKCVDIQKIKKEDTAADKEGPVTPGCSFVKRKPGALNIREYSGTEYKIVDVIGENDYTSKMVFTGHYVTDTQNYTWYEIISPSGQHGYVRSDLVRAVQ